MTLVPRSPLASRFGRRSRSAGVPANASIIANVIRNYLPYGVAPFAKNKEKFFSINKSHSAALRSAAVYSQVPSITNYELVIIRSKWFITTLTGRSPRTRLDMRLKNFCQKCLSVQKTRIGAVTSSKHPRVCSA